MRPREYIDQLRRCAGELERAAGEIGRAALEGRAPDAAALEGLKRGGAELDRLRGELSALLGGLCAEWADSDGLSLEQLEERVAEWELRERLSAGMAGRIAEAAELLERLHAPGCGAPPARELARSAARAADGVDMEQLHALERQAAPYIDLCTLLRGDVAAARRDGALLRRLECWYPQIAWYVRARMRLEQGLGEFDELSDEAVAVLRKARLGAQAGGARHERRRESHDAESPERPRDDAEDDSRPGQGVSAQLARRLAELRAENAPAARWRALAGEYAELGALAALADAREATGDARCAQVDALARRALADARELEAVIAAARACGAVGAVAQRGRAARAWAELMAPGRGALAGALAAVAGRRREDYAAARALCERLLIAGQPNGVRLLRLGELATGGADALSGAELVELLRLSMPALMALGRWWALSDGGRPGRDPIRKNIAPNA